MDFLKVLIKAKQPIKRKIILLAILSSLIPLIIIGTFSFIYLSHMIEKKISTTTTNLISVIDWNINTFVVDVESISKIILASNDVQKFLVEPANENQDNQFYFVKSATRNLLNNITNNKEYVNGIYLGNNVREFFTINRGESNYKDQIYPELVQSDIYQDIIKNDGRGILLKSESFNLVKGTNFVSYGKLIKNINTFDQIGALMISFDESVFDKMFKNLEGTGDILIVGNDKRVYYNKNKRMFTSSQIASLINGIDSKKGIHYEKINGKKYVVNYSTNKKTNWKIVSILPYHLLIQEAVNLRTVTISLMILAFFLALISAFFITKRMTGQLSVLVDIANKMEQREVVINDITFNTEDEIGRVGKRFISLYNRNNDLMMQLYESKLKAKEAQLLTLQNHINPHFLYNTLNSIYWMAEQMKAKPIAKIVLNMSKFFRIVLNNGDYVTTVQNEMEQIKSYLEILNIRYGGTIDIVFEIDQMLNQEKIIKLLFQPLVENAVNHGLAPKEGKREITITGKKIDDVMIFEVIDNGIGFNYSEMVGQRKGYAIKNIDERIKLYYGSEYGLSIESEPNKGTVARFTVSTRVDKHKVS